MNFNSANDAPMVALHEIKTLNYAVSDLLMCNVLCGYQTRYIWHESIPFSLPGSVIMSTRILWK